MGRRAFIQRGTVGLAAAAGVVQGAPARAADAKDAALTKLAMVRHRDATDEAGVGRPERVRAMVHRAVRELSGKDALADAWGAFVSPKDVVGLKLNVRAGRHLSTQPCTVAAIVEGLKAAGVKERNIILWDAWNREFRVAGFTVNESRKGVRCYGSDHGTFQRRRKGDRERAREALKEFFADGPSQVADQEVWVTKILTEEITALINVPLIKEHRIAGVTIGMKNHFGSIVNPWDLHPDHCDPYLAHLNALPAIKDKTRLILVDGLRGLYNEGPYDSPAWRFFPKAIIAGTDVVAVDALGLRILEAKRKEAGLPPIGDRARHVATAAEIGLGTNDFARIDLRDIDLAAEEAAG